MRGMCHSALFPSTICKTACSFNPSLLIPGAADIRATIQGTNLRISAASGSFAGKDILLLNVAPTLGLQHRHRQPSRLSRGIRRSRLRTSP